ncbi:UbiA prenyltransferase [Sistotremastrum niveocremeum HHB9708]|uniref:UbiA prenyltransferase n=1 Tax=Sistotremastrum niveocremeum HHB9708 TaxID=1314777 RepID=A0A164SEY7_9AGAM|nr:UbiA prenyltransferase [Sistotremastrum niveocremeum HHB9708]
MAPDSSAFSLRPYLQLARVGRFPLGTLFIFWPCAWGATMAAYRSSLPPVALARNIAGLFIASCLVHTTICTLNDICDKEIDAQVERTRKRPLPSGAISVQAASIFLLIQTAACLVLLYVLADPVVIPAALAGFFPFHGLYPLAKRITNWPQLWLGLSAAAGLVVAWQQITKSINLDVIGPFSFAITCWIIIYDTIYAMQDRSDDLKAGVGSTAVLFGAHIRPILSFFAFCLVSGMIFAGLSNRQGPAYFIIGVGSAIIHLTWQLTTVDFDNKEDCMNKFVSNGTMGYFIWGGMLIDYALKYFQ